MMTAKSQLRREELLAAASRVIGEQGLAGASVRAVAQRAEVSAGSVLYHFESFDQLVAEAVRGVLEEFSERRRRLIEGVRDPAERLRMLLDAGIPRRISDELRVVYEVSSVIRDRPQFRAGLVQLTERQLALYRTVIEVGIALGSFAPRMSVDMIADNLVALEDAYGLYMLDPADNGRERYLRNAVGFAEIALDCTLHDRAADTSSALDTKELA
ncbi:TetR/AcrR family transcriptional regulator [Leucobacter sp. wl10]|uniref:TetR/AcrR family transcriptional regulator n=1 Tax=Leucobacter sp. wl10 TaxID=2304677 RepID=UPI000E5AEB2D|nr:TetR family transcriptional regulator [Leucobacter sp. wl10]RGE18973.1 TetR family transcriptional regulator [Leucobacter sp. wl10]